MENSSLPAYAEKKCCLTRAETQQTLVSLKGVFDFETKIDYCEMISWERDMICLAGENCIVVYSWDGFNCCAKKADLTSCMCKSAKCPSPNYPIGLKGKKKKAISNQLSADNWQHTLQPASRNNSTLKGTLSKGAWLNVFSLLWHVQPYVHRGKGTIPHVFLSLYLSCCLYCALCAHSLCFITASSLCLPVTLHFVFAPITGLPSPKKSPLVLDSFKITRRLLKCYD